MLGLLSSITAEGFPAEEMIQKDEVEETWVSVVASDTKESPSSALPKDDKVLSRQTESSFAAPKGKTPKVRAKKKPGPRGQKSKFSKPPDLIIGASEQASKS